MPDAIRFEVQGLRQLGEAFKQLDEAMQKRIAGQATGAGARIVKQADKQNLARLTDETGLAEKNVIMKKLGKNQAGGLTSAHIVTVKAARYPTNNRQGRRTTRRSASHLEFGTVNQTAEPHLGPALTSNIGRVNNAIKDKLAQGIDREARKVRK